jgi:hypothetical protein
LKELDPGNDPDVLVSELILQMLQEGANDRLPTSTLCNELARHHDPTSRRSNPLCGDCCAADTYSISDSGSDRDPLSEIDD